MRCHKVVRKCRARVSGTTTRLDFDSDDLGRGSRRSVAGQSSHTRRGKNALGVRTHARFDLENSSTCSIRMCNIRILQKLTTSSPYRGLFCHSTAHQPTSESIGGRCFPVNDSALWVNPFATPSTIRSIHDFVVNYRPLDRSACIKIVRLFSHGSVLADREHKACGQYL